MSYVQLEQLCSSLNKSVSPEDFFSQMSISLNMRALPKDETQLSLLYQQLLNLCQKDKYTDSIDHERLAKDAQKILPVLHKRAQEKLESGIWGVFPQQHNVFSVQTPIRKYYLPQHLTDGDLCAIYEGHCSDGEGKAGHIVLKILEDAKNNSFLEREVDALRLLHASVSPYNKHLPVCLNLYSSKI